MRTARVRAQMLGRGNAVIEGAGTEESEDGQVTVVVRVRPRKRDAGRCGIRGRKRPRYDGGSGRRRRRALDPGTVRAELLDDLAVDAPLLSSGLLPFDQENMDKGIPRSRSAANVDSRYSTANSLIARYPEDMSTTLDVRAMYLDLLRGYLTRYGEDELLPVRAASHPIIRYGLNVLARRGFRLVRPIPFDEEKRNLGLDWPAAAETMIGMQRLTSLQHCVETVLAEEVPGDLVECGVWRGGACILMRAVLAAYGDQERCVWVADSFAGVPKPDKENFSADENIKLHLIADVLGVSEASVKANFKRYGLLDDRVHFLPGWFKDTLHVSPIDCISVLRLDGDLYESTIQALDALYPRLSIGGFCIIDDYHPIDACRQAVADYRKREGISAEISEIDGSGVFWRK